MLTLPDGSEIVLDQSTDNNRVAEHGNVTLSMQDGILSTEKRSPMAEATAEPVLSTVEVPGGTQFDLRL